MKKLLSVLLLFPLALVADSVTVSNKFLTVNQNGNLNASGVATVEDVATNAVKVQVAEAKLSAVQAAVTQVQGDTQTLAANILSNRVVIYRSAYNEGFSAAVIITDADKLAAYSLALKSYVGTTATFEFKYVCLADIAAVKPTIRDIDALEGVTKEEFDTVPDGSVSDPVYTPGTTVVGSNTYAGTYSVEFTRTLDASPDSYFCWVDIDGDTPSSGGDGINLPNGVKGGYTGTIGDGWDITVVGGVIKGVLP